MQKKNKIAIVMYGLNTGGAELQFLELANYLKTRNKVKIFGIGKKGELYDEIIKNGLDVQTFTYNGKLQLIWALVKFLFEILKFNPHIIISTTFIGNLFSYVSSFLVKTKLINFYTVSLSKESYPRIWNYILNSFDLIIAGAEDIKDFLISKDISEDKIKVIHNWVNFENKEVTKQKEQILKEFNIDAKCFNIGCIARLHIQKGHKYLIEAMNILDDKNIKLYLIGDGPEKENIANQITKSGLENIVLQLGEIRGDDYINLMSAFDLIAMASLYEGLPRTLLDAMYLKKTILTTKVNGNSEAIKNNFSGILVEPKNSKILAIKIQELKSHPIENLGFNAHQSVIEKFSMRNQFLKIENLLGI